MRSYLTAVPHHHEVIPITGVLLVNLGTPEAPTPAAVRRYLAEFLSDPRVTEMPRWLWWWILHGIILRVRPARVARNYQKIWTNEGSPLLSISFAQVAALQQQIDRHFASPFKVVLAMRYGHPSIAEGLEQLRQANAQKIIILPLYPQYASATTGSVFDGCAAVLKQYRVCQNYVLSRIITIKRRISLLWQRKLKITGARTVNRNNCYFHFMGYRNDFFYRAIRIIANVKKRRVWWRIS